MPPKKPDPVSAPQYAMVAEWWHLAGWGLLVMIRYSLAGRWWMMCETNAIGRPN